MEHTTIRMSTGDMNLMTAYGDMRDWLAGYRSTLVMWHVYESCMYLALTTRPHVTQRARERCRALGFDEVREELSETDELRMSLGVETTAQALHEQSYDAAESLSREFEQVKYHLTDEDHNKIYAVINPIIVEMERLESDPDPAERPDFTCAVCKTPNYYPHEGQFFVEKYEPGTLCQTCMLRDAGAIS